MKTTNITEFVEMEALPSTEKEQLLAKAEVINAFLQKQDGFIDSELIKAVQGNIWYLIYHIENRDKLKAVAEKLKNNNLFDEIAPLIVPGSMEFTFYERVKNW